MIDYKKVYIGNMCNNNCLCCQFANQPRENRFLSEIESDLKEKDGFNSLVIVGGEASIRTDFIDILNAARLNKYSRIKLLTNGRAFADWDLAKVAVEYGVRIYEIKVAGSFPQMHEAITGEPGSFDETVQGIQNIRSFHSPDDESLSPFIAIRVPLCAGNYEYIEDIVRFLIPLQVDRIIISFDDYDLAMQDAVRRIGNAIESAVFSRIWLQTEKIPLCLMKGYEHHVSEAYTLKLDYQLEQAKSCQKCVYASSCKGIVSDYLKAKGSDEFQPVEKSDYASDLVNLQKDNQQTQGSKD